MLLTEVRVLLLNSTAAAASPTNYNLCSLRLLLRSGSKQVQQLQSLKNGHGSANYSTSTLLLVQDAGTGRARTRSHHLKAALTDGSDTHAHAHAHASRDRRKRYGPLQLQMNCLDIAKICDVRSFSTSSGANASTDGKGKTGSSKSLSRHEGRGDGQVTLSVGEKVKENAKTATYGGVILLGIVVTCTMGYFILSELFSEDSPNNIYTKSFKLCKANQDVQDILGGPIKCYGEETRRGWRRHVAHQQFLHGETKILRMRFYLEGKFNKATVHVEKKGNVNGKYEYSYLVVDVDGYPTRRIEIDT